MKKEFQWPFEQQPVANTTCSSKQRILTIVAIILAVLVVWLFAGIGFELAVREPVEIYIDRQDQITSIYFPANEYRLWPFPKVNALRVERNNENFQYLLDYVVKHQMNPDKWFPRDAYAIVETGHGLEKSNWSKFMRERHYYKIQ